MQLITVVVAMSGKIDIEMAEGMTGADVRALVAKEWNVDMDKIAGPFLIVQDMYTNATQFCKEDELLSEKVGETCMMRMVLPLKAQG